MELIKLNLKENITRFYARDRIRFCKTEKEFKNFSKKGTLAILVIE